MEMTVNTSRILTLDVDIPQAQVNNPNILELTPLSSKQVQIFAKTPGVTQVNLWDRDPQSTNPAPKIYTIDVVVVGDAEELRLLLERQFPKSALRVTPVSKNVVISGYVDMADNVPKIMRICEQFYGQAINNMTVGGVQQVNLHIKVMEVSRTKLRSLGFDFAKITGSNVVASSVSGLLTGIADGVASGSAKGTFSFAVVEGGGAFFGILEALRQDSLLKILSEPTLVTISGRPAYFRVGGEFPILVPGSLGTVGIEYKRFGTEVDFVPIVLGNGKIRLEVRPRVSEIDNSRAVQVDAITVPGLSVREVDTGVEMEAGQTLALAGLVQTRTEAQRRGLPWVSEVPYIGAAFRRVEHVDNEIELLIMVTPELVEAMDQEEVPRCGPGMGTRSPNDWEAYMRGHLEMPACNGCGGVGCQSCTGYAHPGTPQVAPVGEVPAAGQGSFPQPPGPPSSAGMPSASGGFQGARGASYPNSYTGASRQYPARTVPSARSSGRSGFIGPVGYDVAQ